MLGLVRELAEFERAPEQVTNTVEQMKRDGFGPDPAFGCYVAVRGNRIVGISVYYYRYSTWKGKRLYLEDIIVTASERGHGIGKMLFECTMKKSLEAGCTGMTWQVLEWNKPAYDFYNRYGPGIDGEWVNFNLEAADIRNFFGEPS